MSKIIITNKTNLSMRVITKAVSELYEYPIHSDTIIAYQDGEHYCYIKENKNSVNFIFYMKKLVPREEVK